MKVLGAGEVNPDDAQVEFFFGVGSCIAKYRTDQKLATLIQTAADHGFKTEAVIMFFDEHFRSGRIEQA